MAPQSDSLCRREAPRHGVRIDALIRQPGYGRYAVEILDLSTCGFCCEGSSQLSVGDRIFLQLPTIAPLEAFVAWQRNGLYGCRFAHPLHDAVLDMIASRFAAS